MYQYRITYSVLVLPKFSSVQWWTVSIPEAWKMQKFKIDDRLRHRHRPRPRPIATPTPTKTKTDCDIDIDTDQDHLWHQHRHRLRPRPTATMTETDRDQDRLWHQGRLHTFTWFPAHYQALMKSSSLLSAHNSLWYTIKLRQQQEWKLEEFTGVAWHRGVGSWRRKRFWGNAKVCPTFGKDAQSRFRPFRFHIYCFSSDLGSLLCFPFQ